MADDAGKHLRRTLEDIPGGVEAFRAVIHDPKTKADIQRGVGILLGIPARAKAVGILVAIAEIEDKDVRMGIARTLTAVGVCAGKPEA